MKPTRFSYLILFALIISTLSVYAQPTLFISGETEEEFENDSIIQVKLRPSVDEAFESELDSTIWSLGNLPEGIILGQLKRINDTIANIVLKGTRTLDYDTNFTRVSLTIPDDEILNYTGPDISADTGFVFVANNDTESIIMTDDAINEGTEDGDIITLTLSGGNFNDTITSENYTFSGLPDGVEIGSITRNSATELTITLSGNRTTDYDTDITTAQLTVATDEVDDSTGVAFQLTGITFSANDESLSISTVGSLQESTLNGAQVTLTLSEETFDDSNLNSGNFTLNGVPAGVTVGGVSYNSSTTATLTLAFDGTDFDTDYAGVSITVSSAELSGLTNLTSTNTLNISANLEGVTIALSDGEIDEGSEDGESIYVTLSEDEFVGTLNGSNWEVTNLPGGVSAGSPIRTSSTTATIPLSGNRTVDYDSDITNITVSIGHQELVTTASGTISANTGVTFNAFDDDESIALSDDGINEGNEDGEIITVTLTGGTFITGINSNNYTLSGLPAGVTKGSVNRTSPTEVSITLSGNRTTDYDTDITNAGVSISASEIDDYTGANLTANSGVTFNAYDESLSISAVGSLEENTLNGAQVTLTLSEETFDDSNLNSGNFTLNGVPAGVTVGGVSYNSSTTATLTLAYDDTDFDTNYTNFSVTISSLELSGLTDLSSTNTLTIDAFTEPAYITLDGSDIDESGENGESILVTLFEDEFVSTLNGSNWIVTNLPGGVSAGSPIRTSSTTATIPLSGNRTVDYDSDITNTTVSIGHQELVTTASGTISANTGVTFNAFDDDESIALSDDGINEGNEDGEIITVTLTGGTFITGINSNNYTLSGLPAGVTKGSVNRTSPTEVSITLSGNRTTDYDTDITNAGVSISASEIDDYTGANLTANSGVTFNAYDESLSISAVGSLEENMLNGAQVTLTLSEETFDDSNLNSGNFTLNGVPAGVTVGGVSYNSSTTATLTLAYDDTDFDTDYTNFSVTISSLELSGLTDLSSTNTLTIDAFTEPAYITLDDSDIDESGENGESILVILFEDEFVSTLNGLNWIVTNLPGGVSAGSPIRTSSTTATIPLSGNRTVDYDSDITNTTVSIGHQELVTTTAGTVSANTGVTFIADDDDESIALSDDGDIDEGSENGEVITVTLTGGTFINPINQNNFTLSGLPAGVAKGTVTRNTATEVLITLSGNRTTDYDTDITNAGISISASEINDYTGSDLTASSGVTFNAFNEQLNISAVSTLEENSLDGAQITLTLIEEAFANASFDIVNFTLNEEPEGVTVSGVEHNSSASATLTLAYNDTDFDTDYNNFSITISAIELNGITDITSSNTLTIEAVEEPAAISISDSGIDEGEEDGENINVQLFEDEFNTPPDTSNWDVTNLPVGVRKGAITILNPTTATIRLWGDRLVDYDTHITNTTVSIGHQELVKTTSGTVSDNTGVTFIADDDGESITLNDDGEINEAGENGEILTITLTGGTFAPTISPDNFILSGLPAGVSKGTVTRNSATEVLITLSGNRTTDYDSDITNAGVSIAASEVDDYSGVNLTTNEGVRFIAYDDDETIKISDDGDMNEGGENGEVITVTLLGGTFVTGINPDRFILTGLPTGVTKGTVTRNSATEVLITLSGNRTTDYDSDITNVGLSINASEVDDYSDVNLTANSGVTFNANNEQLNISAVSTLEENTLNGAEINLTLSEETFADNNLDPANFILDGEPTGVAVGSVNHNSSTTATLTLAYNDTDFDADSTGLNVTVLSAELTGMADVTSSNPLTIEAELEPVYITLDDSGINEGEEDSARIVVRLFEDDFVSDLDTSNWDVTNLPGGVRKGNIQGVNSRTARITLWGDRTVDYDSDIEDVTVTISHEELVFSTTGSISADNGVVFNAINDDERISISDNDINEGSEDGRQIRIDLIGGTYVDPITPAAFSITGMPEGVEVGAYTRTSATRVIALLSGNSIVDYDTDITNAEVSVLASQVDEYDGAPLTDTTGVSFDAVNDPENLTLSDDGEIIEGEENNEVITVSLTGGTFIDPIVPSTFKISGLPGGVIVDNISRESSTLIEIRLDGNRTIDYDADILNFRVAIPASQVDDRATDSLIINTGVRFQAWNEQLVASTETTLEENQLDGATVSLDLQEEWLVDNNLELTNFKLNNAPAGLSIDAVNYLTVQSAELILSFDGTDFDTDYEDFFITIFPDELYGVDSVSSNKFTIQAKVEPEILNVSIPNEPMIIGDDVTVTITVRRSRDRYTLESGSIAGIPITTPLTQINYATYQTLITIPEGGTDYLAEEDIPVGNLVIKDESASPTIYSEAYDTPISQDNDPIDANTPEINEVTIVSDNDYDDQIATTGDIVTISFSADENLDVPTVTIDNKLTIVSGGPITWQASRVLTGTENEGVLTFNIAFSDEAGNEGVSVSATTDGSEVVYDNSEPLLTEVTIYSNNVEPAVAQAGDSIILEFTSDEEIREPVVLINNVVARIVGEADTWKASTLLTGNETEGLATFVIQYMDLAGNEGRNVRRTTDNSFVTLDFTAPGFELEIDPNNDISIIFDEEVFNEDGEDIDIDDIMVIIEGGEITADDFGPGYGLFKVTQSDWTLVLDLQEVSSGKEFVSVDVNVDAIFDIAGNAAEQDAKEVSLNDLMPPEVSFELLDSNNLVMVFSEPVLDSEDNPLTVDLFDIELNEGNASLGTPVITQESDSIYQLDLDLDGLPDGTEELIITITNNTIFDITGNAMDSIQTTLLLNDLLPPGYTIELTAINNLIVSFTEPVFNAQQAALQIDHFILAVEGGTATLGDPEIVDVVDAEYIIDLDLQGTADGQEKLSFSIIEEGIFDENGNVATPELLELLLNDNTYPVFDISVEPDNIITVEFSEEVQGAEGTNISIDDFMVTVTGGTAEIGEPRVFRIDPLIYEIDLDILSPPDGTERVRINVVDSAIFDMSYNPVLSDPKTRRLRDKLSPTYAIEIDNNNDVEITFTEPVTDALNQSLTLSDFNYNLSEGELSIDSAALERVTNAVYKLSMWLNALPKGDEIFSITAKSNTIYDVADNPVIGKELSATLKDKTPPDDQNQIFTQSQTKQGDVEININAAGEPSSELWFAPKGTKVFSEGNRMTTAPGTDLSILSPHADGDYYLYVIDSVGNISNPSIARLTVDNKAPVIDSVIITAGQYKIGDKVNLFIYADQPDYTRHIIKINNENPVDFTDLGDGNYTMNYLIKEGNKDVFELDDLPVSIELKDIAGNINLPYTLPDLSDTTGLIIYANSPTATLMGGGIICPGDSVQLQVFLTGYSPWRIEVNNGSITSYDSIMTTPFNFYVAPDSLETYSIEKVTDITPNENIGMGTSEIDVYPKTEVNITNPPGNSTLNLEPSYLVLTGDPLEGVFSGKGVIKSGNQYRFYPLISGIGDHNIIYTYRDTNLCYSRDTVKIIVTTPEGDVFGIDDHYCYYDTAFTIEGRNKRDSIGRFYFLDNKTGIFDNGDNTAIINPQILTPGTYTVVYEYEYEDVFEIYKSFEVEYINPIRLIKVPGKDICKNSNPISLIANYDDLGGTFSWYDTAGVQIISDTYDPGLLPAGENELKYQYTSPKGCTRDSSIIINVHKPPEVDFTVEDICISLNSNDSVRFINLTDSENPVVNWHWDFDDGFTSVNVVNPVHLYPNTESRDVTLTAASSKGCVAKATRKIYFGETPKADFYWQDECFSDNKRFNITSDISEAVNISSYLWKVSDGNQTKEFDSRNLNYKFPELGSYDIQLIIETDLGCTDSLTKNITLRPVIQLGNNVYFEDFESDNVNWLPDANRTNNYVFWNHGIPRGEKINDAFTGNKSIYTTFLEKDKAEQSFILGPCFDFTGVERPMLKMDMWRAFDKDRDGAVLQWTENNGATWNTLGKINSGINWYDSYAEGINPGNSSVKWTAKSDNNWTEGRHALDELKDKENVRFRLAYATNGTPIGNEGMAIDNFWIGEREKKVLIEHFTNSSDQNSKQANKLLDSMLRISPLDAIDIQYHTNFPGYDPINAHNIAAPNARVIFYSISNVPYAILDGGFQESYMYNFSNHIPDIETILHRVLSDPWFDIDIELNREQDALNADVQITALKDVPAKELIMFVAVVEKVIEEPDIVGLNGETWFRNVLKKMLPNAAGTVYQNAWEEGKIANSSFKWNYDHVFNVDSLNVVVFIQDNITNEVLQAATTDNTGFLTHIDHKETGNTLVYNDFTIYPNPSSLDIVNIDFNSPLKKKASLYMYDDLGRIVKTHNLNPGESKVGLDISNFDKGVYMIRVVFDDLEVINKMLIRQ